MYDLPQDINPEVVQGYQLNRLREIYMIGINILTVFDGLFGEEKDLLLAGIGISFGVIILFGLSFFLL